MRLQDTQANILARMCELHPELPYVLMQVRQDVPHLKREINEYQAAVLYVLARQYDKPCHILEIGTAWGYSAAILSMAAPQAMITTLNPKPTEVPYARKHLAPYTNVSVEQVCSWDYLSEPTGPLSMVWVDGSHDQVRRDFPWFNRLHAGGLMLFHDYAPDGSSRPCQCVYDAVNELRDALGRDYDVLVSDDTGTGIAGFYKREGEAWPTEQPQS